MREVWKFPVSPADHQQIAMPAGSQALMFDVQDGNPTLWAIVNPAEPLVPFGFRLAGTGHQLGDEVGRHIGSCFHGPFVWHLFEVEIP